MPADPAIQELRDLTRTRKQLVGEIARHTLRLQKALEDANVKLAHVVTDTLVRQRAGRSWSAIGRGTETDPERLADCTTTGLPRRPVVREIVDRGARSGDVASSVLAEAATWRRSTRWTAAVQQVEHPGRRGRCALVLADAATYPADDDARPSSETVSDG